MSQEKRRKGRERMENKSVSDLMHSMMEERVTLEKEFKVEVPLHIISEDERLEVREVLLELKQESEKLHIPFRFPSSVHFVLAARHIIEKRVKPTDFSHAVITEQELNQKSVESFTEKEKADALVAQLKANHYKVRVKKVPVSYFLKDKGKAMKI
jgi:hypothetical protein